MSNGGYKGASPARETSPEQYPGVWELTEQFQAQADGNWPFQETDSAPKSLRFDGSSSNLEKTFNGSGARTSWTWSCWLKRGRMDLGRQVVFGSYNAADDSTWLEFGLDNTTAYFTTNSIAGGAGEAFRDPAAFYHYFANFDGTTFKIFINNVEVLTTTALSGTRGIAGPYRHRIGQSPADHAGNIRYFDGVMAECHFIDGQVLSPSDFAFYDGQGIWQPKRFTGDYSSGPVYSNFLTSSGSFATVSEGPHKAFDGIATTASRTKGTQDAILTFDISSFGFTGLFELWSQNSGAEFSIDGGSNWSAVGNNVWTTVSSDISAVSTIQMRPSSGARMKVSAFKSQGKLLLDASVGRNSFHLDFSDGVKDQSGLSNDWTANNVSIFSGSAESRIWETSDTGWTIASGGGSAVKTQDNYHDLFTGLLEPGKIYAFTTAWQNGDDNGGWWFGDSNSLSLSGTHPNQGRGTNSLGQRGRSASPANDTAGAYGTFLAPNGLSTASDSNLSGFQNINPYGTTSIDWVVDRTTNKVWAKPSSNSTWVKGGNPSDGSSTPTFHLPATGDLYFGFNQNSSMSSPGATITSFSFTPTDRADDIFVDSPVNGNEASTGAGGERRGNYCCLNPLDAVATTTRNGNLTAVGNTSTAGVTGSIGVSSGKWYFEMTAGSDKDIAGIWPTSKPISGFPGSTADSYGYFGSGVSLWSGSGYTYGSSFSAGDIIGVALDLDNGSLVFYKNNVSQGTAFTGLVGGFRPAIRAGRDDTASTANVNFGQHSFSYAPPAGYSPLATSFLPEPTIKRGDEAMDAVLYSGNGASTQTIAGLKFSPDLTWQKIKNQAGDHGLTDIVRGVADGYLQSEGTDQPTGNSTNGVSEFTSDGFKAAGSFNSNNNNWVTWAWSAGNSTTTIAAGGLNSSAYDQSQTWSSSLTSTQTFNLATTRAFDGDATNSTLAATANATNANILFTKTFTNVTKLRVYMDHATSYRVRINGGTWHTDSSLGASSNASWRDLTPIIPANGTVNSIESDTGGQNNGVNWSAVEVNGRLLVDAINDSQTWSNGLTGLSNSTITNPANGFDTDESSYADSTAGFTLDLSGHTFGTGAHTIEVKSGGATSFSVNGSTSLTDPGGGGAKVWTGTHTGELTSLASSATGASVYYIKIDGKYLANPGQNYVTNAPSIPTTVRARPEAGFSIMSYEASGTAGATVAHQLGKAPEFMICKNRDHGQNWFMFHKTVGAGGGFNFNIDTSAYTTDTGYWNGDDPTNYVVNLGNYHGAFGTHDYVLYAWTSVKGYSSFGSYEGSNTNLPFIYTGFSPRWILIANMDNVNDFVIYDTARDANNQSSSVLAANSNNGEGSYSSGYELDILSNGFRIRTSSSGAINQNQHTHVYAAFASHPFASNARAR